MTLYDDIRRFVRDFYRWLWDDKPRSRKTPKDGWCPKPLPPRPCPRVLAPSLPRRPAFVVRHRSRQVRLYVGGCAL